MGKQNVYEDGYKAPMVLAGPGIEKGLSDEPVYLMDLYPTLAELSDIDRPTALDGRSFAMSARDDAATGPRNEVMLAYTDVQRAARSGGWKMIHYPKIRRTEYFNLIEDAREMHPLSDVEVEASTRQMLADAMQQAQQAMGDPLRLDLVASPSDGEWSPPTYVETKVETDGEFNIEIGPNDSIVAVAVGLDRHHGGLAGLRLDLQRDGGKREGILVAGSGVRWMPLMDQLKGRSSRKTNGKARAGFAGFHGHRGETLASLGILVGERQRTPAWGQSGGEAFEERLTDGDAGFLIAGHFSEDGQLDQLRIIGLVSDE